VGGADRGSATHRVSGSIWLPVSRLRPIVARAATRFPEIYDGCSFERWIRNRFARLAHTRTKWDQQARTWVRCRRTLSSGLLPGPYRGPAVPADGDDGARMHEILFATDFGAASLSALPRAIALAKEDNAKLILLHVMSSMPAVDAGPCWYSRTDLLEQREPGRRKALEKLASLVPANAGLPFAPECEAPFDFLPQGILTVASERHADLIVMGVKHAAFRWSSTHMPWTLAHQVVCHAKCPVLTVWN